jgi:hypothetical protein
MKRITTAALMAMLTLASAQDQKVEEGYTSLFNGKDLTGWKYGGKAGKENKSGAGYQVAEGGIIYCTVADGGNLYTEKEYADFSFKFEFKLTANANNGIGIRAPLEATQYLAWSQVLDDSGSSYQKLAPYQYHGSICDLVPYKRGFRPSAVERGGDLGPGGPDQVTLNSTVIVDANLGDIRTRRSEETPGATAEGLHRFLGHGAPWVPEPEDQGTLKSKIENRKPKIGKEGPALMDWEPPNVPSPQGERSPRPRRDLPKIRQGFLGQPHQHGADGVQHLMQVRHPLVIAQILPYKQIV